MKLIAKLALLLGSLMLTAGVFEVGLRVMVARGAISIDPNVFPTVEHRSESMRSDNPGLFWELDPSSSLINSAGFRDREFDRERFPDTVRIAALGDSVTFGYGVPLEDSFPKVLERILNETRPGHEVLNFGVGGYNTSQEIESYRAKARAFQPDIIVLSYVLNDALTPGRVLKMVRTQKTKQGSPSQFRPQLYDFAMHRLRPARPKHPGGHFAQLKKQHAEPGYWRSLGRKFAELAALAEEDGARGVVAIVPMFSRFESYGLIEVHEKVALQACVAGLEVVDLFEDLRGYSAAELRLSRTDNTHPNSRGHAVIGAALARRLLVPREESVAPSDGGRDSEPGRRLAECIRAGSNRAAGDSANPE